MIRGTIFLDIQTPYCKKKFKVGLIADCSQEEAIEEFRLKCYSDKLLNKEGEAIGTTFSVRTPKTKRFYIWVKNRRDTACLVHECTHLSYRLVQQIRKPGISHDELSELQAQISEHAFQVATKLLFKIPPLQIL